MKQVYKVILILFSVIVVTGLVAISSNELYRVESKSSQSSQNHNQVTEIEEDAVEPPADQETNPNDSFFNKMIENFNNSYYLTWLIILISFLSGGLIVLLVSKPFRRLKSTNERNSKAQLVDVVRVQSNEEIGQLVKSLNHVVVALEQTEQNRRIFYADMVRELRNPLVVDRSRLEETIDGMILPYRQELDFIRNELVVATRSITDLQEFSLSLNEQFLLQGHKSDFQTFLSKMIEEATLAMGSINKGLNTAAPSVNKNEG